MLDKITYKKTYLGKSFKTYGNEYLITLRREDGRRIQFRYHDGIRNDSELADFIYALFLDASSYEDDPTIESFNHMWDCEGSYLFNACKKQMERRNYFFSPEEVSEVSIELEELGF